MKLSKKKCKIKSPYMLLYDTIHNKRLCTINAHCLAMYVQCSNNLFIINDAVMYIKKIQTNTKSVMF